MTFTPTRYLNPASAISAVTTPAELARLLRRISSTRGQADRDRIAFLVDQLERLG
jgi:hypothetical protein